MSFVDEDPKDMFAATNFRGMQKGSDDDRYMEVVLTGGRHLKACKRQIEQILRIELVGKSKDDGTGHILEFGPATRVRAAAVRLINCCKQYIFSNLYSFLTTTHSPTH